MSNSSKAVEQDLAAILAEIERSEREAEDIEIRRALALSTQDKDAHKSEAVQIDRKNAHESAAGSEKETKTKRDEQLARELQQRLDNVREIEADSDFALALSMQDKLNSRQSSSSSSLNTDTKFAQELQRQANNVREIEADSDFALALSMEGQSSSSSNLDKDYALVLQTQFQLEKERGKRSQYDIKTNEDALFAAALQKMELAGSSEAMLYQTQKHWEGKTAAERKKIIEDLGNIIDSPAVKGEYVAGGAAGQLTDAHKYTSTLIRAGIPVLTNIDDQFKLSSIELTPDQVLKEVLEFIEKRNKEIAAISNQNKDYLGISTAHIQTTLAHVQKSPAIEASETQANAHHLLSRTWTLAKKMGVDYMAAVATLLSDNIADAGSCIPGLIARLYATYARMLALQLGVESPTRSAGTKPATK